METTNQELRIMLAEDDPNLGEILKESLNLKGFKVSLFTDGEQAWKAFSKQDFDLCLLDVMMPKKDGFTLAKEIRKVAADIPIVFLTAKNLKEDKVEGFKSGADDYLTKPFSIDELVLRIEAIMRRSRKTNIAESFEHRFEIGDYVYESDLRNLRYKDQEPIKLTTKEGELLKLLAQHRNQVLERDVALKTIWGNDNYFTGRSMDVYITKLRKFLKEDSRIEIINVHGVGFKLTLAV